MPRATIDKTYVEQLDLKSLPGGEVQLRRLSYGELIRRRQIGTAMTLQQVEGDQIGTVEMINRKMTEFEFTHCIVEHNLEDENGKLLDFRKSQTFDILDPRVGEEIARRIDEMNDLDSHLESLDGESSEA